MLSPSPMVLINTVDIYQPLPAIDAVRAPEYAYAAPDLRGVPCSVQAGAVEEVIDEQKRLMQVRQYKILFGSATLVKPRAMIIYVDSSNVSHTLFAHVERDEAGRGAAFVVHAIEKVLV